LSHGVFEPVSLELENLADTVNPLLVTPMMEDEDLPLEKQIEKELARSDIATILTMKNDSEKTDTVKVDLVELFTLLRKTSNKDLSEIYRDFYQGTFFLFVRRKNLIEKINNVQI
jgi:hypothetical protein